MISLPTEVQTRWAELQEAYPVLRPWRLTVDRRAKSRLGVCSPIKRVIALSAWLVEHNPAHPSVMESFLHEVAHAIVPRNGHGKLWLSVARAIGATDPCRIADTKSMGIRHPAYEATCPHCQTVHRRVTRRTKSVALCRCAEPILREHEARGSTHEELTKALLPYVLQYSETLVVS